MRKICVAIGTRNRCYGIYRFLLYRCPYVCVTVTELKCICMISVTFQPTIEVVAYLWVNTVAMVANRISLVEW